jgi:FAD/FMN-containing dehydrogenase
MAVTNVAEARAVERAFQGRILAEHESHAEFVGAPAVLVPAADLADVGRALQLAKAADLRVFVRSGSRIAETDVTPASGVVISMEKFQAIEVAPTSIAVGAAVTLGDLAQHLKETDCFLPLGDDPSRSLVSAVLGTSTPFPRSTSGKRLLDGATQATGVSSVLALPTRLDTVGVEQLAAGQAGVIVAGFQFDPTTWASDAVGRWCRLWLVDYDARPLASLCDRLFANEQLPAGTDLSVRVTTAAYGMTLVVVRATGRGDPDQAETVAIVERALEDSQSFVLSTDAAGSNDKAGESLALWMAAGPGESHGREVYVRFGSQQARSWEGNFRADLLDAIDYVAGVDVNWREHAPGVEAWAELRLTTTGEVEARAHLSDARAPSDVSKTSRRLLARAMPVIDSTEATRRASPGRMSLRGMPVLAALKSVPGFGLARKPRGAGRIPDFAGEVIEDDGADNGYESAADQYARGSYDAATKTARMSPAMIAYPTNVSDVVSAVSYAAANGMKVVARSGGHQYCGLSSGGSDTLLLDMGLLRSITLSGSNDHVVVQPGAALEDLSYCLSNAGLTIPHGECPLVRLGGHVQTGGVGHQLRSFGVALDWVRSFKMVTRDPRQPGNVYLEREFNLPRTDGPSVPDDGVFRAVLGGGPGSWGVITEVTFAVIHDGRFEDQDKLPTSSGHNASFLYSKPALAAAMEQLRQWSERVAHQNRAVRPLPAGVDLFLSAVSGDINIHTLVRPPVVLIETMALDPAHEPEIRAVVESVRGAVSRRAAGANTALAVLSRQIRGRTPVSQIAHKGVRKRGIFSLPKSGREFDLPYKKSLHLTTQPFTKAFCGAFVDLVDDVQRTKGCKVVFQAVVCGGAFAEQGKATTHMQRRDALVQLVFDVFYQPGMSAVAAAFQDRMKKLLPDFSANRDIRMFWGTFEDTAKQQLDMRKSTVQDLYYDSPAEYCQLQEIKQYTDPIDLFHTSFTVKLP